MANAFFGRLMAAISPRNDNILVLFNHLADSAVKGSKVLAMMSAVNDQANLKNVLLKSEPLNRKQMNTPKKSSSHSTKLILPHLIVAKFASWQWR